MAKATKATEVKSKVAEDNDFLNGLAGQGTECIGAGDTSANFLKIAQSNTPELDETDGIPGLKVGHFYSSLLKKTYGKAIDVVVLKYELCWMVWGPNRGGLVAKLPVNGCKVIKADNGKMHDYEGNDVQETQNFYVMLPDHLEDGLMTFSIASTGLKYGRQWNTMIVGARAPNGKDAAPIFGVVWQIETVKNTNKQGSWYTIGLEKAAAIQQSRFITGTEWKTAIEDGFNMAKLIPALTRQGDASGGQALIASDNDALNEV